jgi:hypothetical protein
VSIGRGDKPAATATPVTDLKGAKSGKSVDSSAPISSEKMSKFVYCSVQSLCNCKSNGSAGVIAEPWRAREGFIS